MPTKHSAHIKALSILRLTPVVWPSAVVGLLMTISSIPSGKFSSVADKEYADTSAPYMLGGSGLVTVVHLALVIVGALLCPDDDMFRYIAAVIVSHCIGTLNSNEMLTLVAFESLASAWMHASCPGLNFVISGAGPIHRSTGTSARKP